MSDKWKAYDYLLNEDYIHLTVNQYSLNFVDLGAEVCPVQERPKNCSKATYRSECSVSIITRILLATLSSISSTFMRFTRTHKWLSSRITTYAPFVIRPRYILTGKARIKYEKFLLHKHCLHVNKESKNK